MSTENPRPLDGVRVFELSIAIAGPMCGRNLAHFGAEVIKVESRKNPDVIRLLGAGWIPRADVGDAWGDCGPVANEFMGGKKSIGVDLKAPEAKEIARRLITECDVFLTNYSTPAVRALGFGYEAVSAIKPDIVYASVSGFGTDVGTPYYDFIAWGPNQAPLVGLDDMTGWPDRPQSGFSSFAYPDFSNSFHATVAVLAALEHRDRTGEGEFIEISQQEATAAMFGPWLVDAQRGKPPKRDGHHDPDYAPHALYPCRGNDRWVAITIASDDEWRRFAEAAGHREWIDDSRFATGAARLENQDTLDEAISAWTRPQCEEAIAEHLQRAGVTAAPLLDNPRVALDPQLRSRRFWLLPEHARFGRDFVTGCPIVLSDTPGHLDRGAPSVGQDNDEVLGGLCGYSAAEIAALVERGVVYPMARPELRLERRYLSWLKHFLPDLDWPTPGARP